jgi:hypothetical protein
MSRTAGWREVVRSLETEEVSVLNAVLAMFDQVFAANIPNVGMISDYEVKASLLGTFRALVKEEGFFEALLPFQYRTHKLNDRGADPESVESALQCSLTVLAYVAWNCPALLAESPCLPVVFNVINNAEEFEKQSIVDAWIIICSLACKLEEEEVRDYEAWKALFVTGLKVRELPLPPSPLISLNPHHFRPQDTEPFDEDLYFKNSYKSIAGMACESLGNLMIACERSRSPTASDRDHDVISTLITAVTSHKDRIVLQLDSKKGFLAPFLS